MSEQREYLKQLAVRIRDERKIGANTANRIGSTLLSMIEELGGDEYLSKIKPDETAYIIKFLAGLKIGNFNPGFSGGSIDEDANAELESLKVRSFFCAAQYVLNNVTVEEGDRIFSAGANIKSVTPQGVSVYLIEVEDLYEGYIIPFEPDDLLIGKFNQSGGFFTSYLSVNHVDNVANTMVVTLADVSAIPPDRNFAPVPLMVLARRGNYTRPERQGVMYLSATDLTFYSLDGVDSFIISPLMKKAFIGKIQHDLESELGLPNSLPVQKGETVIYGDVVLARKFLQVDRENKPVPHYIDRGPWSKNSDFYPYKNLILSADGLEVDQVWNYSSLWRCLVPTATEEPKFGCTQWLFISGDETLAITFDFSNGKTFKATQVDTTITAKVRRGTEEITSSIQDWQWKIDTGNPVADTAWNSKHIGFTDTLPLTTEDMGDEWITGQIRKVKFTLTVFVRDGQLLKSTSKTINYNQ